MPERRVDPLAGQMVTDAIRKHFGTLAAFEGLVVGMAFLEPDEGATEMRVAKDMGVFSFRRRGVFAFRNYDKVWAKHVAGIIASVTLEGGADDKSRVGELRRVYDKKARVSLVLPSLWKVRSTALPSKVPTTRTRARPSDAS